MRKLTTISVAITTALTLSACQSMPQNMSADEMVRYGYKRSLLVDNQYNYDGKISLQVNESSIAKLATIHDNNEKKEAKRRECEYQEYAYIEGVGCSSDAESEAVDAAIASDPSDKKSKPYQIIETRTDATESINGDAMAAEDSAGDTYEELYGKGSYLTKIFANPVGQDFAKKSYFSFSGAVDLPKGKVEIAPALNVEATGIRFQSNMAVAIDAKKMQLIIAPNALSEIILTSYLKDKDEDNYKQMIQEAHNKYLLLSAPEDIRKKITDRVPVKTLIKVLPEALDLGYAAIDKDAFKEIPMDAFGQKSGASHRIRMTMTEKESIQFNQVFTQELVAGLEREKATNHDINITPEHYEEFLQMLKGIVSSVPSMAQMMFMGGNSSMPAVYNDVYLDGRGRIVAIQQVMPLGKKINNVSALDIVGQYRLSHFGRPSFKVNPKASETYDLSSHIKESLDGLFDDNMASEEAISLCEGDNECIDMMADAVAAEETTY